MMKKKGDNNEQKLHTIEILRYKRYYINLNGGIKMLHEVKIIPKYLNKIIKAKY